MAIASVNFPRSDAGLLAWSSNFNTLIGATPTAFGLVAAQATAYDALHDEYAAKLAAAVNPPTRTQIAVEEKNVARQNLKDAARDLAQIIQGTATVTDAQRISLDITVISPSSPVSPPPDAPVTQIFEMNGWTARGRVKAFGSERRGLAEGAVGIQIYSYVGATPPTNVNDYRYEGASSRSTFDVAFDEELAVGTKVWICACWVTARFLTSPACAPIGLLIGGGVPETNAA